MQARNLPAISGRYWAAILAASMCGANTGDFLSRIMGLGHWRGVPFLIAAFFLIVWAEKRSVVTTEAYYWLAIILLRTGATNLADLSTHDFKLGYPFTLLGLTTLLILVLIVDPAPARRDNANTPQLPATDLPYWIAMLIAGTLGTAGGDCVADSLGLGMASMLLTAVFGATLLAATGYGAMSKWWYWATIVAARTAGTALGDLLASRRGFDLGLWISTACTASLLAAIILIWPPRRRAVAPNLR
jgi:uncharacterized membrane-anchored protein